MSQWRRRTEEVRAAILDSPSRKREKCFLGPRQERGVRDTTRKAEVREAEPQRRNGVARAKERGQKGREGRRFLGQTVEGFVCIHPFIRMFAGHLLCPGSGLGNESGVGKIMHPPSPKVSLS